MNRARKEVSNTKYYEILGINKNATPEEIRKSYRKLAAKMHPDKGGEQGKFQDLQQAYETLSDPKKKEVYDTYGEEGLKEGMGGGADFDPFSMFFNGGGRSEQNVKRKCKARLVQMKITLKEAYMGGKKSFEYSRRIICKTCSGNGSANPAASNKCTGCNGKGVKTVMQRMGHILLQSQQTCPECQGEGQVIKDKCKTCKAEKVQYVNKKIDIELDKGIPDGHRYSFPEQGDEYPEIETGDLFVEIFVEKDNTFVRKGADLVYKCEISLLQALTGLSFVITHLDGRKILIKSKEGEVIKPAVFKTIRELGMPFHNAPFRYGNLYIDFEIDFPSKLNEEETKQISDILLNHRLNKVSSMKDGNEETYTLTDFKPEDENSHHSGGKTGTYNEEEDEEDGGGHHKTHNCANQ